MAGADAAELLARVQVVRGRHGAVSSGHEAASREALRVLGDGGNVVDAAIAGAGMLAVVVPYACGLGGDLFLLYHEAATGRIHGLNGTGAAPTGAHRARFLDGILPTGILSSTVPGAVAAWEEALSRFGTRPLGTLLEPAIRAAGDGFPAHSGLILNTVERQALLAKDAEASRLFLPNGAPYREGETVVQEDLARCLALIAEGGAPAFYEGPIAKALVAGIEKLGGLFALGDFARHRSLWQEPVSAPFCGYDVVTMPPNSAGIDMLLELLVLEASGVASLQADDPYLYRLFVGAWRAAKQATREVAVDPVDGAEAGAALLAQSIASPPKPLLSDGRILPSGGDTTSLTVMDAAGNAVSLIQSVSGPFASGIVVEGTGILLNNRMRGFNTREGSLNCVAPHRRPFHTLIPAMVMRDGSFHMAITSPGAAGQPITLMQVLTRALAWGEPIEQATAAPRWSVAPSGKIILENTAPESMESALRHDNPDLSRANFTDHRFGSVKAVCRDGDELKAVADYRRVAAACAT